MAESHPGATNTYVSSFAKGAASDQLQVEYSRNPESFIFNQIATIVPVDRQAGKYLKVNTEDAIRVVDEDDYLWADNQDRPAGETRRFQFLDYACDRRSVPFTLGDISVSDADFNILAVHARGAATKAMTIRSKLASDKLLAGLSSATAAATGGVKWDVAGGSNVNAIQLSIQSVCETISKATGGVVGPKDIQLMVSPTGAHQMAASDEIQGLITGSPAAYGFLTNDETFNTYGLPSRLYGVNVVVEDAVRATVREGITEVNGYLIDDDAVFVSRPGGLVGAPNSNGAPSMSTLTAFMYEDMTVETEHDTWNRKTKGAVSENYDIQVTNAASGYVLTDIYD